MTALTLYRETGAILSLNGGSSSIKFALYGTDPAVHQLLKGKIERIGLSDPHIVFSDTGGCLVQDHCIDVRDHPTAAAYLNQCLEEHIGFAAISAIGHRVVHGMYFNEPRLISPELLQELHRISPYDPDHLPVEIELMEIFRSHYPRLPQVACFDTHFHQKMPRVAKLLPIPRRYDADSIQRFGFHGLSYAYLMEELLRTAGEREAGGRIILAHLGSGASMTAVNNGQSVDTTMGFTPASGMPMGSRPGDLDPGLLWYWVHSERLSAAQLNDLINHQSGLLGVSESSSDLRDLLARQADDIRAAEAVEMFCYHARKWIGSLAAALGGLDTLVFSGGIGENAAPIRARICENLGFLGIQLDEARNSAHAPVISGASSHVTVRVIPTDEEIMIARQTLAVLQGANHGAPADPAFQAGSHHALAALKKGEPS